MSDYRIIKWKEVYKPNRAVLHSTLAAEGFKVSHWVAQPDAVYGWNKLAVERTHWVVSGSLKVVIRNVGEFILQEGDLDFIPAETFYCYGVEGDEPVMYFVGEKPKS